MGSIVRADFVDDASGWVLYSAGRCAKFKADCSQQVELLSTDDGGKTFRIITPGTSLVSPQAKGDASGQERSDSKASFFRSYVSPEARRSLIGASRTDVAETANEASDPSGTMVSQNEGFDKACVEPVSNMDTWWHYSPYYDTGVYLGGSNVHCKNNTYLNSTWVSQVSDMGWGLMPLWVGPQAPCLDPSKFYLIDPSQAYSQGVAQADLAVNAANSFGITNSIIYYDMEYYPRDASTCSNAVLSFVQGWIYELHGRQFKAGVYFHYSDRLDFTTLALLDAVWITKWDGIDSVWNIGDLSNSLWSNHQRIHQYCSDGSGVPCTTYGLGDSFGGVQFGVDGDVEDAPVVSWGGNRLLPSPTLLTPPDGATNQSSTPTFTWTQVTGNAGYRIQVATSSGVLQRDPTSGSCPDCKINDPNISTDVTSYTPAPGLLDAGTLYYWEVHALIPTTSTKYGEWSAIFSFTTSGGADFSITATPSSQAVTAGNSTNYTVSTATTGGSPQMVNLSVSGLPPSGASVSFNPPSVTSGGSSTLTVNTASSTPVGSYTLMITGTGLVTHSTTVTLVVNAPLPTLTSLSPSSATAGGSAFTLTVYGSNFVGSSVVRWNGSDRLTTYVSGGQLQAAISSGDIALAGTAQVTVFNPAPGGGTSNGLTFSIVGSGPPPTAAVKTFTSFADVPGTAAGAHSLGVDSAGNLYVLFAPNSSSLAVVKSTNGGQTFGTPVPVPNSAFANSAYDFVVDSANAIHVVWWQSASSISDVYYSRSVDGGGSFSAPIIVRTGNLYNGYSTGNSVYPHVASDGAGNVYVVYAAFTKDSSGSFVGYNVWVSQSTNGGSSFNPEYFVQPPTGSQKNPTRIYVALGKIYVLYADETNSDLYFVQGNPTSGFSSPRRLNQTPSKVVYGGGDIAVAPNGTTIYAVYADATYDAEGDIYFAKSTDSGATWGNYLRVNDNTYRGQYGASIGLDNGGTLHVVWTDQRNNRSQTHYSASTDQGARFSANINLCADQTSFHFKQARLALDNPRLTLYVSSAKYDLSGNPLNIVLSHGSFALALKKRRGQLVSE
jgi:hypothetical protein